MKMILCVMTWDGIVKTYHRRRLKEIGVKRSIETYIQTVVLRKTLASMSGGGRQLRAQLGRSSGDELSAKVAVLMAKGKGLVAKHVGQ